MRKISIRIKYVPEQSRNPRRAYDENGNEIPPMTVGSAIADGYKTVSAY